MANSSKMDKRMTEWLNFIQRSYSSKAGVLSLGVGVILLAAYAAAPEPFKLLLALAYIIAGVVSLLLARQRKADAAVQVVLSVITGFGLLFCTVHAAWWMALAALAVLLVALVAQTSTERALLLAAGHLAAVLGSFAVRWWVLYPELTGEFLVLGLGLLVGGQVAAITLLRPVSSAAALMMPVMPSFKPTSDLSQIAMQIRVTADGLSRATDAINQVVLQLATGASEQVTAISLTHERLDTFLKLSEEIREQARSVTLMAGQAAEFSSKGQTSIEQAIAGIDTVRVQVTHIAETIVRLGELTQRIDEIILSVSEIATQSNLLALNASIEAARAGVHGRGFAVVADEVRTLSQQSTSAAQQVRAILGEIQNAMKQTVEATQSGMEGVDSGISMTREANTIMQSLSQSVNESFKSVKAIYDVIRQQMEDLEEIAITIERIERITQQNLASTRMVETVSAGLSHLSGELQIAVGQDSSAVDQDTEDYGKENTRQAQQQA
jgi:methyl-accepting chemotaxis protein